MTGRFLICDCCSSFLDVDSSSRWQMYASSSYDAFLADIFSIGWELSTCDSQQQCNPLGMCTNFLQESQVCQMQLSQCNCNRLCCNLVVLCSVMCVACVLCVARCDVLQYGDVLYCNAKYQAKVCHVCNVCNECNVSNVCNASNICSVCNACFV